MIYLVSRHVNLGSLFIKQSLWPYWLPLAGEGIASRKAKAVTQFPCHRIAG